MEQLLTAENLAALVTLTGLEIILGIDNVVFISILAAKLPRERQAVARRTGLLLAMIARLALLLAVTWVMRLTGDWFEIFGHGFSGRDLILIVGGGFLIAKATHEIHDKIEGSKETLHQPRAARFHSIIVQIVLMDLIFSLDSVITAVGMVDVPRDADGKPVLWIPITIISIAIIAAIVVMLIFAGPIARFIEKHPTTKMLALAFLFMIGLVLVLDGFEQHVPKGYVYSAIVFSLAVEMMNLWMKKRSKAPPEAAAEPRP